MSLPAPYTDLADADLASRVAARDHSAFEALMRRYNGRLFRVARSVLKDDADAEDAVQDAYLEAYKHMDQFRGDSQLSTWLTRITINQALMRLRKQKRDRVVVPFAASSDDERTSMEEQLPDENAEAATSAVLRAEVRRMMEQRIDQLPASFRAVFIMRDVEEMSVQETADALGIPSATVRTRLFRARALLRDSLTRDFDHATSDVFSFAGARCDRIVARVLERVEVALR